MFKENLKAIISNLPMVLSDSTSPENISLTRVILALAWIAFIIGTLVDISLAIYGISWANYGTFASITGGGSILGKVGDKITNIVKGGNM